jgi:quercetin dioxygenase-like cupin family protein
MGWTARRVVTGHDESGKSVFLSDGAPPTVRTAPDGAVFHEMWNTREMPAPLDAQEQEPTEVSLTVPPEPSGTKIRINELPPGTVSPTHRTQSVDYGIVLSGELVLVLDDSETVVRKGDVVVQRGTNHRWENRSDTVALVAFILVDARFTDNLLSLLPDDTLSHLFGDPMRSSGQNAS